MNELTLSKAAYAPALQFQFFSYRPSNCNAHWAQRKKQENYLLLKSFSSIIIYFVRHLAIFDGRLDYLGKFFMYLNFPLVLFIILALKHIGFVIFKIIITKKAAIFSFLKV